jgi:predicted CopG family antitoxin
MGDTTTITVSDEVWRHLDERKERGQSFDDLLREDYGLEVPADA